MMTVVCLNCKRPYPDSGSPYQCPRCGGLYDDLELAPWRHADYNERGIWRYLWMPDTRGGARLSLGEGNTPLLESTAFGRQVYFKCEFANPTGSFKDRGTAALVSFLVSRGVMEAIEDSSGNAGASFAAYAACAGITATVFVPLAAASPKRNQIAKYGSAIIEVPGNRSESTSAARRAAEAGRTYASHAYLPQNLAGYSTCAFEIVEQLGRSPAAVVMPAGQGGLLLGLGRGFKSLMRAGAIPTIPKLIGVQAAVCAPLAALYEIGATGLNLVTEGATVAEGVRVRTPLRADAVVRIVRESRGRLLAVDENRILPGRDALARMGFYVEPTSALVWQALADCLPELGDPVVVVLTGSGYKVRS